MGSTQEMWVYSSFLSEGRKEVGAHPEKQPTLSSGAFPGGAFHTFHNSCLPLSTPSALRGSAACVLFQGQAKWFFSLPTVVFLICEQAAPLHLLNLPLLNCGLQHWGEQGQKQSGFVHRDILLVEGQLPFLSPFLRRAVGRHDSPVSRWADDWVDR